MEIHARDLIELIRREVAEYERKYKGSDVGYLYMPGNADYTIIPYWAINELRSLMHEKDGDPYKFIGEIISMGVEEYRKKYGYDKR